jgi:Flp pilus assembly protein TadG
MGTAFMVAKRSTMLKLKFRGEHGSAILETALVAPLLLLILIGAAELGRIAYAANEVSNAARAGAAFGAQSLTTEARTDLISDAAVNDAGDFSSGTLTATANTYCVCMTTNSSTGSVSTTSQVLCTSSTANAANYCPTSTTNNVQKTIIHYVRVSTTATVKTMFHYPGLPTSYTLNGFTEMRANQ